MILPSSYDITRVYGVDNLMSNQVWHIRIGTLVRYSSICSGTRVYPIHYLQVTRTWSSRILCFGPGWKQRMRFTDSEFRMRRILSITTASHLLYKNMTTLIDKFVLNKRPEPNQHQDEESTCCDFAKPWDFNKSHRKNGSKKVFYFAYRLVFVPETSRRSHVFTQSC